MTKNKNKRFFQNIFYFPFFYIYRKTPYWVPGTTLVLKIVFLKVVPGTKFSFKIFQNFFRSKNKVFGPVQIPEKKLF